MERAIAIRHASRAANAVFRAAGGPKPFTWLHCLDADDAASLAAFVLAHPSAPAALLYRHAVRNEPAAAAFAQAPLALQLACDTFVAVVRALEPRVRLALATEAVARRAPNVVAIREARS